LHKRAVILSFSDKDIGVVILAFQSWLPLLNWSVLIVILKLKVRF